MSRSPSFAGVILAAGASTRMGRDKALLPWRGGTFLSSAIAALKPSTELVIVVGGANSEFLKPTIYAESAYLVVNKNPDAGQFSSLQLGLQEVLNRGRDAAIVTLVDRPAPALVTVSDLKERFLDIVPKGCWGVVPQYGEKHGHPIVIGREMIEQFLRASVTSNARDILHSLPQHIEYFPVNDPAVAMNVDTPEEYQALSAGA